MGKKVAAYSPEFMVHDFEILQLAENSKNLPDFYAVLVSSALTKG